MVATAESLDAVWGEQLPAQATTAYTKPNFHLWDGSSVRTACGTASSSVGPFYCPGDSTVYLDMNFFSDMERTVGAQDTPLAEEYIVAHEFGHHIQNLLGTMDRADRSGTGATSDSVRLELQADCYAGIMGAQRLDDARSRHGRSLPDRAESGGDLLGDPGRGVRG